jgi:hypothetical protein
MTLTAWSCWHTSKAAQTELSTRRQASLPQSLYLMSALMASCCGRCSALR